MEVAHRPLIWNIQVLPKRTANGSIVYILAGSLPIEALIDRKRLNMILPLANNRTLYDLINRQSSVKKHTSNSWVIVTQSILHKYYLPYITDIIVTQSILHKYYLPYITDIIVTQSILHKYYQPYITDIIVTQSILHKYYLPSITDIIEKQLMKEAWTKEIDMVIYSHWKEDIKEEVKTTSSMR